MSRPLGRRLHTVSGAIVLGAFLVEHLLTNASVLGGAAYYDQIVGGIERWKLLPLFEVLFIILPLGFHAIYGLMLLRRPPVDGEVERYGDRRYWTLQRVTAPIVLLFVVVHFWELRAQRLFFGMSADVLYTTLTAHLSSTWASVPWVALFYVVGIGATCFHLANGLFAASAVKGWATPRMRIFTNLIGGALFILGLLTVLGFATGTRLLNGPDPNTAPCGADVPTVPVASSAPRP